MHALLFAYPQARRIEIELRLQQRPMHTDSPTVRDRLGKALISLGEHLVTIPPGGHQVARPAA